MIRRPPRSTLFPTRRSSDLNVVGETRVWVATSPDGGAGSWTDVLAADAGDKVVSASFEAGAPAPARHLYAARAPTPHPHPHLSPPRPPEARAPPGPTPPRAP